MSQRHNYTNRSSTRNQTNLSYRKLCGIGLCLIFIFAMQPLAQAQGASQDRATPAVSTDAAPLPCVNDSAKYQYVVSNMTVAIALDPSGDVTVMEYLKFRFYNGTFGAGYRKIPHWGFDWMKEDSVTVRDESGAVLKYGMGYNFKNFKGEYEISWVFPEVNATGRNGTVYRSFVISYVVTNAVRSVSKTQLGFDWYAAGSDWEVPVKNATVAILLPGDYSKTYLFSLKYNFTQHLAEGPVDGALRAEFANKSIFLTNSAVVTRPDYAHWRLIDGGDRYGIEANRSLLKVYRESRLFDYTPRDNVTEDMYDYKSEVIFWNRSLQPHQPFRITVYYPKIAEPPFSITMFLRENTFLIATVIFLIFFLIVLAVVLSRQYSARVAPKSGTVTEALRNDYGKLGALLAGKYREEEFISTLTSLAQRGVLRIVHDEGGDAQFELVRQTGARSAKPVDFGLTPAEKAVIVFIRENSTLSKASAGWPAFRKEMKKAVVQGLRSETYFSSNPSIPLVLSYFIGGLVISLVSGIMLWALIYSAAEWAVVLGGILIGLLLGGAGIMVTGGVFMPKYTRKGRTERALLNAQLEDSKWEGEGISGEKPQELPEWFENNGAALMVAPSMKNFSYSTWLRKISSSGKGIHYAPPWYSSNQGTGRGDFSEFAQSFALTYETIYWGLRKGGARPVPPATDSQAVKADIK